MSTVLLAEDHNLVRQAIKFMIEADPDFSIVGEAADGLEAIELVDRLKPEILVVDVMMPGLNGLDVTKQVVQRFSETRVIVLSMHADEAYVLEALKNGASGYVLKESSIENLLDAFRQIRSGMLYLSPPLSQRAIQSYTERAQDSALAPYDELTAREREVMQLTAEGFTSSEVAKRLFISPRTAETHRANLMRKLNLRSQAELIRFALRKGILPLYV